MNVSKLLVLTTTFPRWHNDNMPGFVYDLSSVLREKGIDVSVLAPHGRGAKFKEEMNGLHVHRFAYFFPFKYQKLAYEGGMLPNFKQSFIAKMQAPFLFISEIVHALYIIRTQKIDSIHSHFILPSGFVGAICAKFLRKTHVVTIHAADLFALETIPFKKQILRFILNNTNQITVVSSHLYDRLLNLVPADLIKQAANMTKIIPMGVYIELLKPLFNNKVELRQKYGISSEFVLLFMGRLAEKKGIPFLLKSMPQILSQKQDVCLLICGDGPIREELEFLVEQLKLNKFVTFCGFVANQTKVDYLLLSDILIVPSIVTESGDTEGLPVIILEGLAAGKVIIASDVGGVKDVIKDGENACLVEQKNPDQIAKKVLTLMKNDQLIVKIAKNAMESIGPFDWNEIGERYKQLIV